MFGRIQNIDNRVLDNISRIHKPALNKIMITASRAGNAGIVWWAICLPFLINSNWRATGANFVFGLAWAHLMGEIIIKHIVKRVRPCHTLDDDEQRIGLGAGLEDHLVVAEIGNIDMIADDLSFVRIEGVERGGREVEGVGHGPW